MDPHNADDNTADDNTAGADVAGGGATEASDTAVARSTTSRKKRGVLFGGIGMVVVAAVAVTVLVLGDGDTSDANAAADEISARLDVSLPNSTTTSTEPAQPPGTVRLADGATADLVKRDVADDGTLPVPQDLDKAAWWGAGLGESGAMLLSGHVNWDGEPGPFEELLQIDSGEQVNVHDDSGDEWSYQVDKVQEIDKDELPAKAPELFDQGGEHRLVLVTCGGDFVGGSEGYDSNVIATAHLVSSPQ